MTSNPRSKFSPAPWAYEYNPYTAQDGSDIPAFEVFDHDGNRVFMTEEDQPAELQEANARLGSAAPRLLASLMACARLLADYDESEGEEGDAYREAMAAIAEAAASFAEGDAGFDFNPQTKLTSNQKLKEGDA